MKRLVLLFASLIAFSGLFAQDEIWMRPNKGQWHNNVEYRIDIPGGHMYLEKSGFTYAFSNNGKHYDEGHHHDHPEIEDKSHAVKTHFVGANPSPVFEEIAPSDFYENYFYGNDPSQWVTNSVAYNEIKYLNLYESINLHLYQSKSTLKYDIIVHPGGNPSDFKVQYEGQDGLFLKDDALQIITSLGSITEQKPVAYQVVGGLKKKVKCNYVLSGDQMSFEFPDGYDETQILYIDPELTFSSFTGATSDNWGMTASPDQDKRLVAAGIVFGGGYPITAGAFDGVYGGGSVDIGLTKFNADGSAIIFSTFIGGSGAETPHSLVTNDANELYIMGATSSTDFPVGGSPYQGTNNGGPGSISVNGISFGINGTDIFVIKLSPGGNTLLGGTYLGGANHDGISEATTGAGALRTVAANYGDQLRGEVIVDEASNVYIASTTTSNDFPVVGGPDVSLGGGQDAVVAKFNSNLSSLLWSTYLGGSDLESGNSLQLSSTGDIFVAGGTKSNDLPNTAGGVNSTFGGGVVDGYVMKYPAPAYGAPNGTYLGTSGYDQAYFVQLDIDDFVYVYGQSDGAYDTSGDNYINPGSGQFIHKLSNDLSTTEWSSVFGAGTGNVEISPTAFLVSDCYEIYIAGWGGETNQGGGSPFVSGSTTLGFPTTADAYQTTTSGSNFYLAVFSGDMDDLKYATFMGDPSSSGDHVDGGTSRFDKSGIIYHAVCAACASSGGTFPTTPGAYSTSKGASNCNLAAFQFELSQIEATLSTATPVICIPDPVEFENNSENGDTFFWDFGDGGTSTEFEPTHFYDEPGIYTVMLIVSDAAGCYTPDTAFLDVEIFLFEGEAGALSDTICPGTEVQLYALGGSSYTWGPPDVLDDPSSAEPIAIIDEETTFTVLIESVCGTTELEVTVYVYDIAGAISPDTAICVGGEASLWASGGETYSWSPPDEFDDPTSATPTAEPVTTTYYHVEIVTVEGCLIEDSTKVLVDHDIPFPSLVDEVSICKGDSIRITAGGASDYLWEPDYAISDPTLHNPYVSPEVDTTYLVTFTNACGSSYDSVRVNVIVIEGYTSPDTTICPGDTAVLTAYGGETYQWRPGSFLSSPNSATTLSFPLRDIEYTVYITDEFGCMDTTYTTVSLYDRPEITVSPAVYPIVGDTVSIWASGDGDILWSPPNYIECITCENTVVYPPQETFYMATITDHNGCTNHGIVPVYFDPLIFVPNAFTPDGDDFNNVFKAVAHNILEFEMLIFNRWGEIVYVMDNLEDYWDGSYNNSLAQDDVYVWQIIYTDLKGNENQLRGHVVLLK